MRFNVQNHLNMKNIDYYVLFDMKWIGMCFGVMKIIFGIKLEKLNSIETKL